MKNIISYRYTKISKYLMNINHQINTNLFITITKMVLKEPTVYWAHISKASLASDPL